MTQRADDGREAERILLDASATDLLKGLGAEWASPLLGGVARLAVRRFVADVLDLDAAAGVGGLSAAADVVLSRFSGPVRFEGADQVPASGPLVVVSNHPGMVDGQSLWRVLSGRPDLRVIALDRPFLRAIPHVAARLMFVADDVSDRTGLVRRAVGHLRAGGAILTFPAGKIEPDPALRRGDAIASLEAWGRGVELFTRLVPETVVLPVAVSGVISPRLLRHPLARWRPTPSDRELAAATLQVFFHDRSIRPVLSVGRPMQRAAIPQIRAAMAALIAEVADFGG